jgi:hypothetical protein
MRSPEDLIRHRKTNLSDLVEAAAYWTLTVPSEYIML